MTHSSSPTREQDERTLLGLQLRKQGKSWAEIQRDIGIKGFANQYHRIVVDDCNHGPEAKAFWL